jgi:hypothetical protein
VSQKVRPSLKELQDGQVWKMENAQLLVSSVGKLLVEYKLLRAEAKRAPTSLSNRKAVEKYLRDNKAILVRR